MDEYHDGHPLPHEEGRVPPPPKSREQQATPRLIGRVWYEMETAWQARTALQTVSSDDIRDVLQHPAYRSLPGDTKVPVSPCLICGEGILHVAGTLQTSLGRLLARACDTCGFVDLDPDLVMRQ